MNKENLLKMADFIEKVPQEMFDISKYRRSNKSSPICNSIGCVIGHCTELDPEGVEEFRDESGDIDFKEWSEHFTGLINLKEWRWCFSAYWEDLDNTPTGAAKRIRYLVKYGLPEGWKKPRVKDLEIYG